jgi:hypothetical protein
MFGIDACHISTIQQQVSNVQTVKAGKGERKMTLLEDFPTIVCEMVLLLDILFLLVFTEKAFEKRDDRMKEELSK